MEQENFFLYGIYYDPVKGAIPEDRSNCDFVVYRSFSSNEGRIIDSLEGVFYSRMSEEDIFGEKKEQVISRIDSEFFAAIHMGRFVRCRRGNK